METEYKGYKITFNEFAERWEVKVDDSSISDKSLKALKKKIDAINKKGFKRIAAILRTYDR